MAVIKSLPGTKSLKDMLDYLESEGKTEEYLKSGINCTVGNIEREFNIIKELYNKPQGKQYYHITQSFSPKDDITPKKAHEIGIEWISENIEDHQIYIVTHIDKDHLHNHFVVNSVNIENGLKLQINPKKLENMKLSSNEICLKEGLSTINMDKNYGVRKTDKEYRLEKNGITTWKSNLRKNIEMAAMHSDDFNEFRNILKDNFNIDVELSGRSFIYKENNLNIIIRASKLGGSYNKNAILQYFKKAEIA